MATTVTAPPTTGAPQRIEMLGLIGAIVVTIFELAIPAARQVDLSLSPRKSWRVPG